MNAIIRSVIVACVIQVIAFVSLGSYIYTRNNQQAAYYAAMAERNAAAYTDDVALRYYNELQVERSDERAALHEYIDKRIDLKLRQALEEK
ncbi:hypothetical protein AEQ67_09840 [Pseudomonas sp. RIT-PI-q]|uniref:hypothetical protein n=1 Tax=Pseudomonas sp. RIT-PI-q TaxID=1690247 RepID=UPI0006CCE5D8|nr:hypothetical protein [Pseudomonas sp. RIT-PI-q]KPG99429.1 hypothetical protein AEQ67_09840 [Pseudomonas sp. RIT-PI-q]